MADVFDNAEFLLSRVFKGVLVGFALGLGGAAVLPLIWQTVLPLPVIAVFALLTAYSVAILMTAGGMIGRAGSRRAGGESASEEPCPDLLDLNGRHETPVGFPRLIKDEPVEEPGTEHRCDD